MTRSPECEIQKAPMRQSSVRSVAKCTSVIVSWWSIYNPYTRDCDHTSVNTAMRHTLSEVTVWIWYIIFSLFIQSFFQQTWTCHFIVTTKTQTNKSNTKENTKQNSRKKHNSTKYKTMQQQSNSKHINAQHNKAQQNKHNSTRQAGGSMAKWFMELVSV